MTTKKYDFDELAPDIQKEVLKEHDTLLENAMDWNDEFKYQWDWFIEKMDKAGFDGGGIFDEDKLQFESRGQSYGNYRPYFDSRGFMGIEDFEEFAHFVKVQTSNIKSLGIVNHGLNTWATQGKGNLSEVKLAWEGVFIPLKNRVSSLSYQISENYKSLDEYRSIAKDAGVKGEWYISDDDVSIDDWLCGVLAHGTMRKPFLRNLVTDAEISAYRNKTHFPSPELVESYGTNAPFIWAGWTLVDKTLQAIANIVVSTISGGLKEMGDNLTNQAEYYRTDEALIEHWHSMGQQFRKDGSMIVA